MWPRQCRLDICVDIRICHFPLLDVMHFPILWRYLLHDVSSLYVELIFTFCTGKCIINVNDDISTDGLRIQLQNELENFSFYLFSLQIYKTEFPAHTRGTNKYKNLFLKCQISIFKGAAPAVRVQYRPFTIRLPLAPKASVRGNTTSKKHLQNNKNTQEIGCTVRAQPRFSLLLSWNDEAQRCSWRRIRHGHTLWFCVPPLLQCGSFATLVLFSS